MRAFDYNEARSPLASVPTILTVTINPALDRNVTADRLVFEDRAYILNAYDSAGGRGINASRVIHSFGGDTLAVLPCGGETGDRLAGFLDSAGFPYEAIGMQSAVRVNLSISDEQGLTIKLNERGPVLTPEELERLEAAVCARMRGAAWVMLCGSLPPHVPDDFYARLIRFGRRLGVPVLLDADGDALREGLEARPSVVCPNQQEAEALLGTVLLTRRHMVEAAETLRKRGAESVLLSLGSRGALLARPEGVFEIVPPPVDAVCPIGAGDALAAAYVWALTSGHSPEEAARWGVAAGTASALLPGIRFATLAQTDEMRRRVEVRRIP